MNRRAWNAVRTFRSLVASTWIVVFGRNVQADGLASPAADRAVVITVDRDSVDQGPLLAAVKAHLSGLPVRILFKAVPRAGSVGQSVTVSGELARANAALGTFLIERGQSGDFLIFFTETDGITTLIRRLPRSDQGVRVTVEQAAIVVRSLVEALLDGGRIGIARQADGSTLGAGTSARGGATEKERSEDALSHRGVDRTGASADDDQRPGEAQPPGAPRNRSPRNVAIGVGVVAMEFAADAGWRTGATLGVRWFAVRPLYVGARYAFFSELEARRDSIAVGVTRHPLEVMIGYGGSARFAGSAEFGFIADYATRETRTTGLGYRPTPESRRWMLAISGRAGVSWAIAYPVELALRGGVELLVTRYSYVAPAGLALISPNLVRPRVDLELAVTLW